MSKLVACLGLLILGCYLLEFQVASSCTAEINFGMRELNNRKAAFMERQQDLVGEMLKAEPDEDAPSPDDPNAF